MKKLASLADLEGLHGRFVVDNPWRIDLEEVNAECYTVGMVSDSMGWMPYLIVADSNRSFDTHLWLVCKEYLQRTGGGRCPFVPRSGWVELDPDSMTKAFWAARWWYSKPPISPTP